MNRNGILVKLSLKSEPHKLTDILKFYWKFIFVKLSNEGCFHSFVLSCQTCSTME